ARASSASSRGAARASGGGVPASSERAPAARASSASSRGAARASGGGVPASSERAPAARASSASSRGAARASGGGVPASSERAPAARASSASSRGAARASGGGVPASSERWWSHVTMLADDAMEGRNTGSPGHKRAAEYVAAQFKKAGLEPAGTNGFIQTVKFKTRKIDEAHSSLALVRGGETEALTLGEDANFSLRIDPAPSVDAPLV